MENEIVWYTGINHFKKNSLSSGKNKEFTLELREDIDFDLNKSIDEIFYDHLKIRHTKKVEVLYSGGLDSELVMSSCIKNKIPVEANTLIIKAKGAIINVVDLYYSEKFCRENNIKQNLFVLDANEFYEGGHYLEYLVPYNIIEPHVASHFWLIEKCNNFPVIGGDWPWVQTNKQNKIISPYKLDYSSYERFMNNKGIIGIGNMISHSFESCFYFIKSHIKNYNLGEDSFYTVPFLKYKLYGLQEPRIKSYGWENCPPGVFNMFNYKIKLVELLGITTHKIIWGPVISALLDSNTNYNTKFK